MHDDPRIHVSLSHLRSLEGAARGLSFLPQQPSASSLNGRHASRLRGRGLNFEELRHYRPGDDIRTMDPVFLAVPSFLSPAVPLS